MIFFGGNKNKRIFQRNRQDISYEDKNSTNPLVFKYYSADEIVDGKPMREHLKFALSWWHTMDGDDTNMFGCSTADRT